MESVQVNVSKRILKPYFDDQRCDIIYRAFNMSKRYLKYISEI